MLKKYLFAGIVVCALAAVIIPYFVENYSKVLSAINRLRTIPAPPARPELGVLINIAEKSDEQKAKQVDISEADTMPLQAWLITLESFNTKANAEQLAEKLKNLGYPAFVQSKENLFWVYVGPIIKLNEAEALAIKIHKQTQVKGTLVAYDPTANSE
ncbi:MAG: Sporulation protein [Gammaproteobacteria bacterium]|jgi:cell division septation protein DedD|nr:Sporulation protein [Gammaproteobacteria bacterium]